MRKKPKILEWDHSKRYKAYEKFQSLDNLERIKFVTTELDANDIDYNQIDDLSDKENIKNLGERFYGLSPDDNDYYQEDLEDLAERLRDLSLNEILRISLNKRRIIVGDEEFNELTNSDEVASIYPYIWSKSLRSVGFEILMKDIKVLVDGKEPSEEEDSDFSKIDIEFTYKDKTYNYTYSDNEMDTIQESVFEDIEDFIYENGQEIYFLKIHDGMESRECYLLPSGIVEKFDECEVFD